MILFSFQISYSFSYSELERIRWSWPQLWHLSSFVQRNLISSAWWVLDIQPEMRVANVISGGISSFRRHPHIFDSIWHYGLMIDFWVSDSTSLIVSFMQTIYSAISLVLHMFILYSVSILEVESTRNRFCRVVIECYSLECDRVVTQCCGKDVCVWPHRFEMTTLDATTGTDRLSSVRAETDHYRSCITIYILESDCLRFVDDWLDVIDSIISSRYSWDSIAYLIVELFYLMGRNCKGNGSSLRNRYGSYNW